LALGLTQGQGQHGGLVDGVDACGQNKIRSLDLAQGDRQAFVQPTYRTFDLAFHSGVPEELGVPPAMGAAKELEGCLSLKAAAGAADAGHRAGTVLPGGGVPGD
jgi:hypothetical protein